MASIFTDAEKASIDSLFVDIHDTFKGTIYAFVEEATSVGSDVDYNPLYNRTKAQSIVVSDIVKVKELLTSLYKVLGVLTSNTVVTTFFKDLKVIVGSK